MSAEPLASLDRTTLRERALGALRSAITSGRYRPGDHLGEVELATHLGVSRGTVREALRHLQQEGLVSAGNRGMLRVNTISPTEVRELFRVRAALESLAVRDIIRSPDSSRAVTALREALSRMCQNSLAGVQGAWFCELFNANTRTTGASLAYQLSAVVSGFTPLIATALYISTGWVGPAILFSFYGLLGLVAALATRETWGRAERDEVEALERSIAAEAAAGLPTVRHRTEPASGS